MTVHLIGGSTPVPFSRAFFNVTLGDILESNGREQHKLTLFLTDGTTLEVCQIEALEDDYIAVRAYQRDMSACDTALNLIPYSLIYRIEIAPRDAAAARMGFNWAKPTRKHKRK